MKISFTFFLFLSVFLALDSFSQDTIPVNNKLHRNYLNNNGKWAIEIPIWIPGFRGEYSYGDISLEGEDGKNPKPEQPIEKPGFGDVFKRLFNTNGSLNFVFMGKASFTTDKFIVQFDGFSGNVGQSTVFRYNNKELISAHFSTNLFRLFGGYEIVDVWSNSGKLNYRLQPYGGIRYQDVNLKVDIDIIEKHADVTPLWVEPILGVRNELALKRWDFILNGDFGVWDVKNEFSFMINFATHYRISNLISLKAGWTVWNINYKKNISDEDLKIKLNLAGPSTAITFHF